MRELALALNLRHITDEVRIVIGTRLVARLTLSRSALAVLVSFVALTLTRLTLTRLTLTRRAQSSTVPS